MPIYEYECESCKHCFEKRQGFHDEPAAQCPQCQGQARRVIRSVPIIFKGSGFYVTDHRGSSPVADSPPPSKGQSAKARKQAQQAQRKTGK